jgi:hypothetical protein
VSENISFNAKWALEQIEKNAVELRKEIVRLETALDEQTGVVRAVKSYPLEKVVRKTHYQSFASPEAARAAAEKAREESLPLVEENKAIIEGNRAVLSRLIQVITNAGLPKTVSVPRPRSRYKTDEVQTEWASALSRHIPLSDGWSTLEDSYREWMRRCAEWRSKIDAEARQKQEAEKVKRRDVDREILRREMVAKYELPPETDLRDVLFEIVRKNKYLRLAHYLEANRGDWSEGCDYAETGLDGFVVESDIDREIYAEISRLCSDWQGDGRAFRDCKWNYGRLYQMAAEQAPELVADRERVSAEVEC